MKIVVVGTGYVGLSLSVLIAQKHDVVTLDIEPNRVNMINKNISPVHDDEIQNFLSNKDLKLKATLDKNTAYKNANYIIIATPTDYDENKNNFDTSTIETVIQDILAINNDATIVIKSTIPLGYVKSIRNKFNNDNIFFSPEFLRETKSLHDNLYPSRIIVGDNRKKAMNFARILSECSLKPDVKIIQMNPEEAEAVKLFSNTYLAMRISFFNELDTFSEERKLDSKNIIDGVCMDPRIGNYYNNPSFGYGGYCLPKDTKQLLSNFKNVPNNVIKSVIQSNKTRKKYIINSILKKNVNSVGIYRLIMKKGSDNFRSSAVFDIINGLKKNGIIIYLYEPLFKNEKLEGIQILDDINEFFLKSDLIVANRISSELKLIENKLYTRDIFQEN